MYIHFIKWGPRDAIQYLIIVPVMYNHVVSMVQHRISAGAQCQPCFCRRDELKPRLIQYEMSTKKLNPSLKPHVCKLETTCFSLLLKKNQLGIHKSLKKTASSIEKDYGFSGIPSLLGTSSVRPPDASCASYDQHKKPSVRYRT